MPWVRFDDQFTIHRKVSALSDAAFRLHVSAVFWCARNLTDGFLPEESIDDVCSRVRKPARFVAECVDREIWHLARDECGSPKCPDPLDKDGWRIHDYLDYQFTKEQVTRSRKNNARRQALFHNPELKTAVRDRDGNKCRYCGRAVRWGKGRAGDSGTYDHVDPDGPNSADNLVVACMACNSAKADRTPEAAGMTLLPVPTNASNASRNASKEGLREGTPTRPEGNGSGKPPDPASRPSGRRAGRRAAQEKPPWCGSCNETTRLVEIDDNGTPAQCVACHPVASKEFRS